MTKSTARYWANQALFARLTRGKGCDKMGDTGLYRCVKDGHVIIFTRTKGFKVQRIVAIQQEGM